MVAIKSTENRTEVALRSYLHRAGLRFRKYGVGLPGKPDIVFHAAKVVIFVDGDFWHARLLREKGLIALKHSLKTASQAYWISKFQRRLERDDEVSAALKCAGWVVVRLWESEVRGNVASAGNRVATIVRSRQLRANRRMKLTKRGPAVN